MLDTPLASALLKSSVRAGTMVSMSLPLGSMPSCGKKCLAARAYAVLHSVSIPAAHLNKVISEQAELAVDHVQRGTDEALPHLRLYVAHHAKVQVCTRIQLTTRACRVC